MIEVKVQSEKICGRSFRISKQCLESGMPRPKYVHRQHSKVLRT